jgi:sugar-specific transcriptional regulator TrmB
MLPTKNMVTPLLELGLNKYEAKVYLTLIGEGISTAKNISDITGIPYGKVYEIINSLAKKGFTVILPSKPMKCQAISPKEAIVTAKKNMEEKYQNLEKHITRELEPMFAESKKFIEPKGVFWIINGRANITKKIEELIQKAKHSVNIHCSSNGLSRLILHKEALQEAKNKGVNISIASTMTKEVEEEAKSLNFCDIRKIKTAENHLYSIDGQECLVVEPIPDDDNIVYGRDLGMWVSSSSFAKFLENFFTANFNKSRKIYE